MARVERVGAQFPIVPDPRSDDCWKYDDQQKEMSWLPGTKLDWRTSETILHGHRVRYVCWFGQLNTQRLGAGPSFTLLHTTPVGYSIGLQVLADVDSSAGSASNPSLFSVGLISILLMDDDECWSNPLFHSAHIKRNLLIDVVVLIYFQMNQQPNLPAS